MSLTPPSIAKRQAEQVDFDLHDGLLPLHASAVISGGLGVLISSSRPHGGKTGVLLALMAAGARFVGDDCILLSPEGRMLGVEQPLEIRCEYLRQLPEFRRRLTARQRLRAFWLGSLERSVGSAFQPVRATTGSGETASKIGWRCARQKFAKAVARRARVRTDAGRLFGADACAAEGPLDVIVLIECHDWAETILEPADPQHVARSLTAGLEQELLGLWSAGRQHRVAFPDRTAPAAEVLQSLHAEPLARLLAGKPTFVLRHPPGASLAELREALVPVIQLRFAVSRSGAKPQATLAGDSVSVVEGQHDTASC